MLSWIQIFFPDKGRPVGLNPALTQTELRLNFTFFVLVER